MQEETPHHLWLARVSKRPRQRLAITTRKTTRHMAGGPPHEIVTNRALAHAVHIPAEMKAGSNLRSSLGNLSLPVVVDTTKSRYHDRHTAKIIEGWFRCCDVADVRR
jgi:hypothetical protein